MTVVEEEIWSTPAIARATLGRLDEVAVAVAPLLAGPIVFLGCGSSYAIASTAASSYEEARGLPAQAIVPSDYRPRAGWMHAAISRTGQTTELVQAMRQAREAGAPVLLLGGDPDAPAAAQATAHLSLEFAPERSVIQTRFISAALLALRYLIGDAATRQSLRGIPAQLDQELATFDPTPLQMFDHLVFLGRGWRQGLALAAALNVQETALCVPEAHQTLEYRHGPIACAGQGTLVWSFDPAGDPLSDAVLEDVRRTGATVHQAAGEPLVSLAQAQLLAVRLAARRGVNPEAPRHLSRAIVLPALEGAAPQRTV